MPDRSIVYGSFSLERQFPVPPSRVFAAWADPTIKAKWFGDEGEGGNGTTIFEFSEGGREYNSGKAPDGQVYSFDLRYGDIVPDQRIVYTYEMAVEGKRISVSLAYIEFEANGTGTRMAVTEHGAFLDGLDNVEQRRAGTEWLMDRLSQLLAQQ